MKTLILSITLCSLVLLSGEQNPATQTPSPADNKIDFGPKESPNAFLWISSPPKSEVYFAPAYTHLSISAGGGYIEIDTQTGKVTLHNATLDQASRQFWDKVEAAFPDFRDALIAGIQSGEKARLQNSTIIWQMDSNRPSTYQLGFRSDGVVVWREQPLLRPSKPEQAPKYKIQNK